MSDEEIQDEGTDLWAEQRTDDREEVAWQEELDFIRKRGELAVGEAERRWRREELYSC
jgi:hypothetical protein